MTTTDRIKEMVDRGERERREVEEREGALRAVNYMNHFYGPQSAAAKELERLYNTVEGEPAQ